MPVTLFTPTFGTNWSPARPSWGRMQPSRSSTSKKKQPRLATQNGLVRHGTHGVSWDLYFGNFIHIFGIGSSTESICLAGGLKIPGSRRPVFLPGLLCAWAVESQRSPTLSCNLRCSLTGDKRATCCSSFSQRGQKNAISLNRAKSIVHLAMIKIVSSNQNHPCLFQDKNLGELLRFREHFGRDVLTFMLVLYLKWAAFNWGLCSEHSPQKTEGSSISMLYKSSKVAFNWNKSRNFSGNICPKPDNSRNIHHPYSSIISPASPTPIVKRLFFVSPLPLLEIRLSSTLATLPMAVVPERSLLLPSFVSHDRRILPRPGSMKTKSKESKIKHRKVWTKWNQHWINYLVDILKMSERKIE